ncbi:MAG: TolC family protein, partial [Algisphaera sp.]
MNDFMTKCWPGYTTVLLASGGLAASLVGCEGGPLAGGADAGVQLRTQVIVEHRQQMAALAGSDAVTVQRKESDLMTRLSEERRSELDTMSGSQAYADVELDAGTDLTGQPGGEMVAVSLDEAVAMAVEGNLDLAVARMGPAIGEMQLEQADAAFDWTFFADGALQKLDTPQPAGTVPGLSNDVQEDIRSLNTGIRKDVLATGGRIQIETTIARKERIPSFFAVDHYYDADALVSLRQPLLRGFGSSVTKTQIELAATARDTAKEELRQSLNDLVGKVERAYWDLALAHRGVLIQQRLLERTTIERDRLEDRAGYDTTPVRVTEANSRVELRRADLIRVRSQVRSASDTLKRLLNSDDLPLANETLLQPTDMPTDEPVAFSLYDEVTTALEQRPELARNLLSIRDAELRQRLADNASLPKLDLTASAGLNGIDNDDWEDAYSDLGDGDYIDYSAGLSFEQPLGNRGPEALASQRRLEREQASLAYRREAQTVVLEVKNALRAVLTNYQLVGATRAARWAAADSLRA